MQVRISHFKGPMKSICISFKGILFAGAQFQHLTDFIRVLTLFDGFIASSACVYQVMEHADDGSKLLD